MHRAARVSLALMVAASIAGGATLRAQGTPQAGENGPAVRQGSGSRMRMRMRRGPGTMMRMMSDPAARLLDEQMLLQLSGDQVSQLITLHETTRRQLKGVTDQLRALMPRPAGGAEGQAPRQRVQLTQAQRDNLSALMDSLRTIRWRATSAATAVLTADQRHAAVRLAMAQRSRMRRGFGGR